MSSIQLCFLCTFLTSPALPSMAFNIDERNPKVFETTSKTQDYFGYKVQQFRGENQKWIIVTAPLGNNGTGEIFKCADNCKPIDLPESSYSIKSIGLSMAVKSTVPEITTCSPALTHVCDRNTYLNGICYSFNSSFMLMANFTPNFQECTKRKVDLVFLVDGSESVDENDFKLTKTFIENIMQKLSNTSIQFAAVQFSSKTQNIFNFMDYQKGQANNLLKKEERLRELGNTYSAMSFVMSEVFTPEAGSNADAAKVMMIITDGVPTDVKRNTIAESDKKNIIRFVIMVNKEKALQPSEKITSLASHKDNMITIDAFSKLTEILDNLQLKLYNIEGTKNALSKSITKELSQGGFSAAYLEDTLILGSVGSDNWRGSLYESLSTGQRNDSIQDPKMEVDSYMGYSVTVGKKDHVGLYFTGAPRYRHSGQVLVFSNFSNDTWIVKHRENGEQIGAYFGGELCALDVDSDRETDFLLVGAPLHYEPQKEGKMFVYKLTSQLGLSMTMNVTVSSQGRFASSISNIQDLNGDGLNDVAVGAPHENDYRGTVYIYLGEREQGLQRKFSQRIMGQTISNDLRFFGLSLDGKMDQGEDGLTDIVVGAQGKVVLLKSRPVLSVSAQLSTTPLKIKTDKFYCIAGKESIFSVVMLHLCFNVTVSTKGIPDNRMNLSYTLDLDSKRQRSRAFLRDSDKGSRREQFFLFLGPDVDCRNHSVYMPNCVDDTSSPVTVKVNYYQSETNQSANTPILNVDSKTVAAIEIPFEKNCRNETCISDLQVDFNFTTPHLLVVNHESFNVIVTLFNNGDDSYNTTLTFYYPLGLSFSKMHVLKETRRTISSCNDITNVQNKTTCHVSFPVYPSQTEAVFQSMFRISSGYNWSETMDMTISAQSENDNKNLKNKIKSRNLTVLIAVDLAVKALEEDSVVYVNFSLHDVRPREVKHVFEVKNLGPMSVPVTVNFTFSTQIEDRLQLKNHFIHFQKENTGIHQNSTFCGDIYDVNTTDCKNHCKAFKCEISRLERGSPIMFTLTAWASFMKHNEFKQNLSFQESNFQVQFSTNAKLSYNEKRYVQTTSNLGGKDDSRRFHEAKVDSQAELIIPPNKAFIVGVSVGGGLLLLMFIVLLLFWLGFFKRKRISDEQDMQHDNTEPHVFDDMHSEGLPVKEGGSTVDNNPLIDDDEKGQEPCSERITTSGTELDMCDT